MLKFSLVKGHGVDVIDIDPRTQRVLDWLESAPRRSKLCNSDIRNELHCHARYIRRAKAIARKRKQDEAAQRIRENQAFEIVRKMKSAGCGPSAIRNALEVYGLLDVHIRS